MQLSDRQAVELFHLLFLRTLLAGPEKTHIVLKGGCNLRFFFGSARYSEDIDFDVAVIAPGTLKKNVDKLLAPGAMLDRQLRAHELGGWAARRLQGPRKRPHPCLRARNDDLLQRLCGAGSVLLGPGRARALRVS